MSRPQTHVEYEILQKDAERGIIYWSFEEFWAKRMESMQFIPAESKGLLAVLRDKLKNQAREQYALYMRDHDDKMAAIASNAGGPPPFGKGIML